MFIYFCCFCPLSLSQKLIFCYTLVLRLQMSTEMDQRLVIFFREIVLVLSQNRMDLHKLVVFPAENSSSPKS